MPKRGETLSVSRAIAQLVEMGRKTGLFAVLAPNNRYPKRAVLPTANTRTATKNRDLGEPNLSLASNTKRAGMHVTRVMRVVKLPPVGVQRFDLRRPTGSSVVMRPDPQIRVRTARIEIEARKQ